jgi:hypothetical protein
VLPALPYERLFFHLVIIRTRLAAKPADIIQRMITVPACTFGLQIRDGTHWCSRHLQDGCHFAIDLVCMSHDFATKKSTVTSSGIRGLELIPGRYPRFDRTLTEMELLRPKPVS